MATERIIVGCQSSDAHQYASTYTYNLSRRTLLDGRVRQAEQHQIFASTKFGTGNRELDLGVKTLFGNLFPRTSRRHAARLPAFFSGPVITQVPSEYALDAE